MYNQKCYQKLCKSQYLLKNDILLYEKVFVTWDGGDDEGVDNKLYDYLLIIKRETKLLFEIFHREYYYNQKSDNEPFSLFNYNDCSADIIPFNRSISSYINNYREKATQQEIMKCFATNDYKNKIFEDFVKYLRLPNFYQ